MRAVSFFGLGEDAKLAEAEAGAAGATGGLGIARAGAAPPDGMALGGKGGFLRKTGGGGTALDGAGGTSVCEFGGRSPGAPGGVGGRRAVPLLGGLAGMLILTVSRPVDGAGGWPAGRGVR